MVDREVLGRRLARLHTLLVDLRTLAAIPSERYLSDRGLQAQAERWLQLAAEIALDLAQHIIADRGYRTPATYREAFQVLREEGVIDGSLADQMAGWAGLRNILVHVYLEVDQERIHEILSADLEQLAAFAAVVTSAVRGEAEGGLERAR